jgi:hypothetical protein
MQHCLEGFNSGVKGLMFVTTALNGVNGWQSCHMCASNLIKVYHNLEHTFIK